MSASLLSRVTVGLSGGVDSSVAALLLKQQALRIDAVFMKNWEEDDTDTHCSAAEDLRDAEAVCRALDIPLSAVNFASEYWERVFAYFLAEYGAGRTPNPDILCNREIKFRAFLDFALARGSEAIATGHYARRRERNGQFELLKAMDQDKDQSYFLHQLDQSQLARALFPLGELHKSEVRRLAQEAGLPTHAKRDSTGICFIGERDFRAFLQRYLPAQPGVMRDPSGQRIGEHDGLMYYTLGQRQGLHIGGLRGASEEPWYVVGKRIADNELLVAQGHDHPWLYGKILFAERAHWISGAAPDFPLHCHAKTRYRQADQACTVQPTCAGGCRVEFEQPQRAITPGQSVVFYQGEVCLGGAVIVGGNAPGLLENITPTPREEHEITH